MAVAALQTSHDEMVAHLQRAVAGMAEARAKQAKIRARRAQCGLLGEGDGGRANDCAAVGDRGEEAQGRTGSRAEWIGNGNGCPDRRFRVDESLGERCGA